MTRRRDEHPGDRRARLRAQTQAAASLGVFAAEHDYEMKALLLAYDDADAIWLLEELRQEFWGELL